MAYLNPFARIQNGCIMLQGVCWFIQKTLSFFLQKFAKICEEIETVYFVEN